MTRQEITITQSGMTTLAGAQDTHNTQPIGVGGWDLDIHHRYDPTGKVLLLGVGEDRTHQGLQNNTVNHVTRGTVGGTPQNVNASGFAVGFDNSTYFTTNNQVLRMTPDGQITVIAGTGIRGYSGDGGKATEATLGGPLGGPTDVEVAPDGSIFVADTGNHRIRRIGLDGIITTVVGNGTYDPLGKQGGDGGLATAAQLFIPTNFALGGDGSLYIADSSGSRVRRVGTDGFITTIAGNGKSGLSGDGGPATAARLSLPSDVTVGPDGSLYIADRQNHRIRLVGTDGIITTFAGSEAPFDSSIIGDGGPATKANLIGPFGVTVGRDGTVYIADSGLVRIRRVGTDGVITTVAGKSVGGADGMGGPATQAYIGSPQSVLTTPDGSLLFTTGSGNLLRVQSSLPGFDATDIVIPSEGGGQVYRFDAAGKHLQTLDALTGAAVYTFGYDAAGRLASVTDATGNVTTIERTNVGHPTAIVGPFGQRTRLTVNQDRYLTTVTSPADETYTLGYGKGGLLTSFTDPRHNTSTFAYDDLGRLTRDEDAVHGFISLERQDLGGGGYKVTTTNAVNGTKHYLVEPLPDGSKRRTFIDGRGFSTITIIGTDGSERTTTPDGTVTTTVFGPDPRFGMLAPVVTKQTVTTPSGLTSTVTGSRTATFTVPGNRTSPLASLTTTSVVNGKTFTSVYSTAAHTVTTTSAEGRVTTTTLDELGRTIQVAVPSIVPTHYTYDARGRIERITQGDRVVVNTYNDAGRSWRSPIR